MNGSGCRAPDSGDHRSGAYTGGPHHRMSGEGGAVGGAAQCTAPAGLIRETVTNVTAIDTWRPYHALHTARCPTNFQLSCGYPAWLAFQVTTNVMTYHSWQQNCFEHLHWIVKLPASILVTVCATEEHQTAADIVMCPNTGHFAASEEKLLLPRCDGLIRYVKIGNRNWSSAGVGLGQGGPNEMFKSGICLLEELLSGSAHTAAAARSGGQTWAGPCLGLLLTCCNMCW